MTTSANPLMSMEAEQAVLAALMLGPLEAQQITSMMAPECFCDPVNNQIAEVCWRMVQAGLPADPVTIAETFGKENIETPVGIIGYLTELVETLPFIDNWKAYADIVVERNTQRKIVDLCKDGVARAIRTKADSTQIITDLINDLTSQLSSGQADTLQNISDVYKATMEDLQDRANNPGKMAGLSTGLHSLDARLGGLASGKLIAIAGRPAMGKSVLAQGIGDHCAYNQDAVVIHYTMEMPSDEVCQRQLSSMCGIDNKRLRAATLNQYEWNQLVDMGAKVKDANLYISDVTNLRVEDVTRQAVQLQQEKGHVDLIVVDYLQLMDWPGEDEVAGLGYLSREFKKLAGRLRCPIIIVCQLNRSCESRPDKRPLMSDLRGSGAIEQDCDAILMCYRDEYYRPNTKSPGIAEIITRKFRQGDCGTDYLQFEGQHYRFVNLNDGYRPPEPEDCQSYSYEKATRKKEYRPYGQ